MGMGRARRYVLGAAAGLGVAGGAALVGHVMANTNTATDMVVHVLEHGVPEVPDIDLSSGLPKTCVDVRTALESWGLGSTTAPLKLKLPGFDLGVEFEETTLTINCGAENYLDIAGTIKIPRDAQPDLPVAATLRLDWEDGADGVPDVSFTAKVGAGPASNVLELSDIADWAASLAPGFVPDGDDLPSDLRLRGIDVGFKWTEPDGAWFDLIAATQIRQKPDAISDNVFVNLLLSITPNPSGDPTVLTGLHFDPEFGDTFTLGMIFRGSIGEYLSSIELPEMHMAFVSPSGRTVKLSDFPADRPLPEKFFKDSGSELPVEYEYDGDITVSASVALDSFGAGLRETFGYAPGAKAVLVGEIDITFRDLVREDVDVVEVNEASLTVTLPELDGSQANALPDWLKVKQTTFQISYVVEAEIFTFEFETGADLEIPDRTQPGGSVTLSPTLKGEIQVLGEASGDVLTIGMLGEVPGTPAAPAWPNPFGLDWLDLHSLGAHLIVIAPLDESAGPDVKAEITASFALGGKTFDVTLTLDVRPDRTDFIVNVSLRDQIQLSAILSEFGVDLPSLFDVAVGTADPNGDPVSLTARLSLPETGDAQGSIALSAPGSITINAATFNVSFLIALETVPGGDYQVIAGARLDATTVGNLVGIIDGGLAAAVNGTPFGGIALPTVALLLNLEDINEPWHRLGPEKQAFFDPLYGCSTNPCDYEVKLAAGVHFLSALTMPADVENGGKPMFDDVFKAFWLDGAPPVLLDLSLPVPSAGGAISFDGVAFDLRLPIRPSVDVRPDWFRAADLSIGLSVGNGLEFKVGGSLGIRMRDETRVTEAACSFKHWLPVSDPSGQQACYDLLDFRVSAALSVGPVPTFTLVGAIESQGGWRQPFGLPFLEFGGVALQLQIEIPPSGNVSFLIGFYVSGKLILDENGFEKDLAGSLVVGFRVIQGPPFVIPEFRGMRIASRAGIELADVVRVYDIARNLAGDLPTGGLPPEVQQLATLPPLSLNDAGLPNISLRNVELMIGLGNFPDVCITPGLRLGAELYIGAPPLDGSQIVVETPSTCPTGPIADPIGCLTASPSCSAAVALDVGPGGILLAGSMGAFDVGPLSWDTAEFEFELKPTRQRLRVRGGASIDPIARGQIDLTIDPAGFAFLGDVELFPSSNPGGSSAFRALIEGEAEVDVLAFFSPGGLSEAFNFSVHAVLKSDFDVLIRQLTDQPLTAFRDAVVTLSEIYTSLKDNDGDVIQTLKDLPDALTAQGVVVPLWFHNPDGFDLIDAVKEIDRLIRLSGLEPPTMGHMFAGIPLDDPLTLPGVITPGLGSEASRCWVIPFVFIVQGDYVDGVCYSVYIDRIPGIGDLVPGAPSSFTAFLTDVIEPRLTTALRLVGLPVGTTFTDLANDLVNQLRSLRAPLTLPCVDFTMSTGGATPGVNLVVRAEIFGQPYGFEIGWNFAQEPSSQIAPLVQKLIGQLFGGHPAPECQPIGTTTIGGNLGEDDGLVADTSFTPSITPSTVPEGGEVTLSGTYGAGLENDTAATVAWGDGTTTNTTVGALRAGIVHTYVDDNPSGTSADTNTVSVTIGDRTETVLVVVTNVAPSQLSLSVDGGLLGLPVTPIVDEGNSVGLAGTFVDPGLADTFTVTVQWGDGTTSSTTEVRPVEDGLWEFSLEHTYADDDPTGTPIDLTTIRVTVTDDDRGSTTASTPIYVRNVAPSEVKVTALTDRIEEGIEARFLIEWTDPGIDDTFWVKVEFGDGEEAHAYVAGQHSLEVSHVYRDEDPSGSPQDDYIIKVTVTDDDTGVGIGTQTVTVHNVDPVVETSVDQLTTQYSDPFGGVVDAVGEDHEVPEVIALITAYDVTPDTFLIASTFDGDTTLPGWLDVRPADPPCVADDDSDYHQTCTWELVQLPDPDSGIYTDIAPGDYVMTFRVTDDDTGYDVAELTITVLPEDARVWYVGPTFAATTSAKEGKATVELRSTIRDITSVGRADPDWDPWPGDIRNATMEFEDRDAGPPPVCIPLAIAEVFDPFNVFDLPRSIGVGYCNWTADIGGANAQTFELGTIVGGYYERDDEEDDTLVTIARPLDSFITGGGYLVLTDSAGVFAGSEGTHANFGFHVKFNKPRTSLQGGVMLLVRGADGSVYQIRSNAMDSLGVDGENRAQFESKANLRAVTDDGAVNIGGGYVLQMLMTDNGQGADADPDLIGFSLWEEERTGNGRNAQVTRRLLFSSHWDGNQTQQQALAGGNLVVHVR